MKTKAKLKAPAHWPPDVVYVSSPTYHSSVSSEILLHIGPSTTQNASVSISHNVSIKVITEPNHPASGQRGLFASKKIDANTLILDYIGEVHLLESMHKREETRLDYRTPSGELRMSVWSGSSSIKRGDEILVSYGKACRNNTRSRFLWRSNWKP
ncbi:hypothetical protein ABKN59_001052 [Abortiporus biennis]